MSIKFVTVVFVSPPSNYWKQTHWGARRCK